MWTKAYSCTIRPIPLMAFLLALAAPGHGAEYDSEREHLEQLRQQLEEVEQQLAEDRAERDEVDEQLQRLDRKVNQSVERLQQLRRQRASLRESIEELEQDYRQEQERLSEQRQALREQIVAAYAAGEDAQLKMLLNETDPGTAQRLLAYYDYFHEARTERIEDLLEQISSLIDMRRELNAERSELLALEESVTDERDNLREKRAQRDRYRQELEQRIAERGRSAQQLEADVAEQESLLEELRQRLEDIPEDLDIDNLAEARGSLPWPVEGDVEAEFGESRGGGLERTGIIISASRESEVVAVGPGRVVFSDWLRGLGLLVIIDHGEGFMTLYGHNEALYVELGDWINAGDRIATVGSSGARQAPGLYFEIRRGDEPQNPITWLR
ncbi:murein hydrolase activator EnvC family protein [Halorhodospira halochloris]|nr:peptidoglycan DD-metalloendopeptidase family protein [Halorhodospira halochloris]MCG5547169.1 peptidoglycan DD-metalloendopeptidase family protein [Halorhodospira halochloris]